MKAGYLLSLFFAFALFGSFMNAQQAASSPGSPVVPRLVNFSGKATDGQGKTVTGVAGATFAIYKEQYEGAPLWLETQNIQADAKGNYTVPLGATKPEGLPLDLFTSGEARWLGVTVNGGQEQSRVLLLSVPYALKAADAETIGGLSASAFMRATPSQSASAAQSASGPSLSLNVPPLGGSGTTNYIPIWTNSTTLGNSVLFQSGTGNTAKVGIGTTTPASTLDVKGASTFRGLFSLPAMGTATATTGFTSQPMDLVASVFSGTTHTAVAQTFQWQAEPVGNNTKTATGSLNLLFAQGTGKVTETGLKIASNGQITFANGQTFPGTGKGSVTSAALSAPDPDFRVSGSPVTTSGTLAVAWKLVPTNADTPNAIVKRDGTGSFSAQNISAISLTAANPAGVAIVASTSSANAAITGTSTGGNAVSDGVDGVTSSASASGIAGINNSGYRGSVGVYGSGGTAVYGQSTAFGTEAGEFLGYNAPNGSMMDGSDGLYVLGGNGDQLDGKAGGDGVIAYGGTGGPGVGADGVGGYFLVPL